MSSPTNNWWHRRYEHILCENRNGHHNTEFRTLLGVCMAAAAAAGGRGGGLVGCNYD